MSQQRTAVRRKERAVHDVEIAMRASLDLGYESTGAKIRAETLTARLANAIEARNHPVALKLSAELEIATQARDEISRQVIASYAKVARRIQKMRAAVDAVDAVSGGGRNNGISS